MSPPLRFCLVTTFYPPYSFGGDAVFVRRLAHALVHRGHHVEVIHCRDAYRLLARGEPDAAYDEPPGVVVHGLESRAGFLSPLATQQTGFPVFQRRAIRRVLTTGFDVIHYHNASLVGGPGVLRYGEGVKLYTPHEYWLVCPTHVLFRYNRAPCVRPHCFSCTLSYRRPPQWWRYSRLLPRALSHLDAILAPSRFTARVHERVAGGVPVVHLPHFIPPPGEDGDAGFRPEGEDFFLYAGRLEKIKGIHTLVPFFRRHPDLRLVIAGEGSYEARLRAMAADAPNIEFVGHLARGELSAMYRRALAVVVPSVNFEVGPLVALEALSHGTPLVARDIGSLTEVVEESGAGCLYRDDVDLESALRRIAEDPALRRTLGERGREAFRRNWTAEVHVERYLDVIGRIRGARLAG